jgi:peptide/nickel transport system substrate-binding protein
MFSDKRVRQALTMLVPREELIRLIRFGLGTIGVTHFAPDSPDFNPNIKPWPYDPRRAAELLDEAGWRDTNGDGIRDRNGIPFRFEFMGTAQNAYTDQLLPILKEEFRKAGIDMAERRLEFTVQVQNLKDHSFDASSLQWVADLKSDPYSIWHSSQTRDRGSNYVNFRNAEADRLIEQARMEFDPEKRKQMYWRLQEILHEEQPYTFVYYPQEAAAYHKRFQNVSWLPARPSYDLTEWFVPKSLQKYASAPAQ